MPGPFPGMDPWLEGPGFFPDFHTTFVGYVREALSIVLPPPFYTALSTRVWLEESERRVEPDVDVLRPANGRKGGNGGGVALMAPAAGLLEVLAPLPDEERREVFVEV